MIKLDKNLKRILVVLFDITSFIFSFYFANMIRFDFNWNLSKVPENFAHYALYIIAISIIVKVTVFIFYKLYSSMWKYAGITEMISIMVASVIEFVVIFSILNLLAIEFSRSIFILTIMTDVILVVFSRFALRIFRRVKNIVFTDRQSRRVLIIGAGEAGALVIRELLINTSMNLRPVAIVDDDKKKVGLKIKGIPVMGTTENITEVVIKKGISEIIIALPSISYQQRNRILERCIDTKCKIKILPSLSQIIEEKVSIQKFRDVKIEDLLERSTVNLETDEVSTFLNNKCILVTGAGGSIGSEICRQICQFSPQILIILDNYENGLYELLIELKHRHPDITIKPIIANIREIARLESIFAKNKIQIVFHAAAHKHVPLMEENPIEAIRNNIFGTLNVAEIAKKFKAEKFVLISTDKAVRPTNIMGATKRIAEQIIQSIGKGSSTEFAAVRFGNVLGSNGSVIPLFKRQIEQGGPLTVTHRDIIRYFMTIPEAAQLVLQAGAMAQGGEIFVLDMGEPVRIYDLAEKLIKLSGLEPGVDINIEITGLRPGEKLYEELLLAEEGIEQTKNKKIFIAKPIEISFDKLMSELVKLHELSASNTDGIKRCIRTIVPEYVSQAINN